MNRKILTTAFTVFAAAALSFTIASAEAGEPEIDPPGPTLEIIHMPQDGTPAYARHDAVIAEVTANGIALDVGARQEQPETATISEDTVILTAAGEVADVSALTVGAKVSVFVDGSAPVPLIYPAQYPASYIVLGDEVGFAGVDIDVYTESDSLGMYLNGAKTLAINVGEDAEIVTVNGSKIRIDPADLANRKLAVFYNMTTMSLPPIANPTRVVVLGDAEPAEVPSAGIIQTAPQGTPAYVRHDAVIAEVTEDGLALDVGAEQPETATITEDTVILTAAGEVTDISALAVGANVSVFVDGSAPVVLIYPPRYPASYIVIGDEVGFAGVDIDVYRESDSLGMYLNGAKTLALNAGEETEIVTVTGSKIRIDPTDLANRKLAVFYNFTTMSLPPITNPTRIVVLGDAEPAEETEYAYTLTVDGNDVLTDENGFVKMLPVRKYAESLGLEVGWNGEDMSVTVGTVPMGVSFKIGVNSYAKARMTPFVLEAAPRLVNDTTYVPVSFFEQVLEAKVEILNACPPEAIDSSFSLPTVLVPTLGDI